MIAVSSKKVVILHRQNKNKFNPQPYSNTVKLIFMILENSTLANFDENRKFIGFGVIKCAATSVHMQNICVTDWTAYAISKGSQDEQFAAIEYFCRKESFESIKQILAELRLIDFSINDAADYGNWLGESESGS